jgi:hypothetical protein
VGTKLVIASEDRAPHCFGNHIRSGWFISADKDEGLQADRVKSSRELRKCTFIEVLISSSVRWREYIRTCHDTEDVWLECSAVRAHGHDGQRAIDRCCSSILLHGKFEKSNGKCFKLDHFGPFLGSRCQLHSYQTFPPWPKFRSARCVCSPLGTPPTSAPRDNRSA